MFIGKAGVKFREAVCRIAGHSCIQPMTKRLGLTIELIMPDRRERDIDNYNNGIFDALKHAGVYKSDGQIDKLVVDRGHVAPPGCCLVTVREL